MSFLESIKEESKKQTNWLNNASLFLFILGTILVPLFFLPSVQDFINTPKLYLIYGVGLLVLFLFLLEIVISKELVIRQTFIGVPMIIFLALVGVSTIFSLIPSVSLLGKTSVFVLNLATFLGVALWFWLLIQLITTTQKWQYLIDGLLVSACLSGLLFLFKDISLIDYFLPAEIINTVSNSNSLFGVFMAVMTTIGLGLLQIKQRQWPFQILPLLTSVIGVLVLLILGFQTPLIILAVGLALIMMLGILMLDSSHVSVVSIVFGLFVATILMLFIGVPNFFTTELPSEVSINASTSWEITTDSLLDNVKSFLLGSGPGTFIQDFSMHRPESMNMNSIAWSTRFERPYSTPFALASELGILGFVAWLGMIFVAGGGIFSGWLNTRPSVWQKVKEKVKQKEQALKSIRLEVFVVIIGFVCATIGMFLSFYEVTMWWLWFMLLGISIVGLSSLVPSFVKERRFSLEVSPKYSLLLSFGMILLVIFMVLTVGFGTQVLLADMSFYKATQAKSLEKKGQYIEEALSYRDSYVPYKVAQARYYLKKAQRAARGENSDRRQVAQYMAKAVNITKQATDLRPKSVETWETLANMYLNAQQIVPGANKWAKKALKQAIKLEPTNPDLHRKLAGVHIFAGNNKKAKESYRKAIKLKPDYVIAYIQYSRLLASQGEFDQAISLYQPIFNLIKDSPRALFNLGRLFYNRNEEGDLERAERVLKRAVSVSENYANAIYALGLVKQRQGDTGAAKRYFDRVREITPDNSDLQQKKQKVENPKAATKSNPTQ
ncbi:MAG: tetratricopeptide repeat protein [Candidatus Magasanikbacteria bacterium]